jgi:outer membrane protein insertion porin family
MNWLRRLGIAFFFLTHATGALAAELVDLIKMEGVPADQVEVLRAVSGFLPGDPIEKTRLERATEKLREFYESKGYPQTAVTAEIVHSRDLNQLNETTENTNLVFKFVLGEPIRMAEVSFVAKNGTLSADLVPKLTQVVDLKPGEPFDRERLKEMKRAIETTLANLDFVDSRVADITTDTVPQGLRVDFQIELGQKVVFSVMGNQFFTRMELMATIENQRSTGLGRDYINVIYARIKDQYVESGFRNVKITPYTFEPRGTEPRKVVYAIEDGPKSYIRDLIFDGNESFTQVELQNLFYQSSDDRIQAKIYNSKMIEDGAKSMIEAIKKRGYLSAKLIAVKTEDIPGSVDVNIRFFVSEGLQTRIQAIDFRGNHTIGNEKLLTDLGLREGEPLNLVQLEDGLDHIKKDYRNIGHLDVKILNEGNNQIVTYSEKNQFAYLNFDIEESPQFRFSGLKIFGNDRTKNVVIEREFRLLPGETLQENKLIESEERLRRLGIFSQVNLELLDDPEQPLGKVAKVSVQEATPGNAGAGFGYRNDLGVRVFGELSYADLWGMDHTWVLNASVNRRIEDYQFTEFSAQVSYVWPWVFLGETTFRPSLTAERREYTEFSADTYALALSLERSIFQPLHLSGSFTYTLEQVRQYEDVDPTQNQQVRIGSLTPLLRMDFRDNPLAPKRGFFALTSFEYATPGLGSQDDPVAVSYGRYQLRTDYYLDFIPKVVWYSSIRGGWLKNFANPYNADGTINPNVTVPLIKQFALGGINSLRGFTEQELNVQEYDANQRVQGYLTYVNYRTQFDYFLSPSLSMGPFMDAGNLNVDNFTFGSLRYGTGMGLRYVTPVGPVNFDWGFKLFPRPGEETNVFYFSIGVI